MLFRSSLCAPDAQWGMVDPDWVAASPRGNFLAVQWPTAGTERCSGLETFDIRTGEFVGRVHDSYPHGDLQILADGVTEVFVSAELRGPGEQESFVDGTPGGTDLDQSYLSIGYRTLPGPATGSQDPEFLVLTDWIYEHMSCRGPAGWCLVTTYANPANGFDDPLEDEIALVALDGSGVTRLAHHRSSGAGYWEQPRASFSSDGRYVVFDTDWGMNAPGTAVYVIDLAETP